MKSISCWQALPEDVKIVSSELTRLREENARLKVNYLYFNYQFFTGEKVLVTALPCVSAMSLPLMCFCTGERFFISWMFKKCCCIAARSLFLCAYYWIDAFFSHIFLIRANELLMPQSQSTSPSEGTLTWLSNHQYLSQSPLSHTKLHNFNVAPCFWIWELQAVSYACLFFLFCFVLFFVRFFVRFFL